MSVREGIKARLEAALRPLVRRLHAWGIRPNHLTVAGGLAAAASGLLAARGHFTSAGVLFLLGSAVDALDGALARGHDGATRFGAVLDATWDRIGEGAVWIGLVFWFAAQHAPGWAAISAAALLFSLLTSYLRAWGERFALAMQRDWLTRPERVLWIGAMLVLARPEWAAAGVAALAGAGFAARLWRMRQSL